MYNSQIPQQVVMRYLMKKYNLNNLYSKEKKADKVQIKMHWYRCSLISRVKASEWKLK